MAQALADLRASAWVPIALKLAAGALGLVILSGIGFVAALRGLDAELPATQMALTADLGKAWLAPPSVPAVPAPVDAGAPAPASTGGITADGRVILNRADAHELRKLPGVGARRAEAIVKLRERLGRFRRIQDLLRVRGIGPRSLRRMRPHLVLDPPEPADGGASAPAGR
ncbi:MAG: helix-hairpin-helix domain-containing protein [Myxococcales bacterium]|nr:helix-hairpin-helix domain-containing protein [Myxococcales bacterium]MCB9578819.1 helix-hairpin-helix domain-containing protein [Polyangiaceae bacterium]